MLPVKTKFSNVTYDIKNDNNIIPIPVHETFDSEGNKCCVVSFQLSKEDLEDLNNGNLLHVVFRGKCIIPFYVTCENIYSQNENPNDQNAQNI